MAKPNQTPEIHWNTAEQEFPTPPGLEVCGTCAGYNGTTKLKYIFTLFPHDPETEVTVSCFCRYSHCDGCGHDLPPAGSDRYDPETNQIYHYPAAIFGPGCPMCGYEEETPDDASRD